LALEAIAVTRRRCWDQDWVVEFDIRGLFDHGLLMTALRKHCQEPWILLYVERWLKAPMQSADGRVQARDKGTPQGGVVSPILANLFLHYAFDLWVTRRLPGVRFARYADDAVLHCKSRRQAEYVLDRIRERFQACSLELHPSKTRIVYCKDINRTAANPDIQFTFLGWIRGSGPTKARVCGGLSTSRELSEVGQRPLRGSKGFEAVERGDAWSALFEVQTRIGQANPFVGCTRGQGEGKTLLFNSVLVRRQTADLLARCVEQDRLLDDLAREHFLGKAGHEDGVEAHAPRGFNRRDQHFPITLGSRRDSDLQEQRLE
jgi:hypothetical protein